MEQQESAGNCTETTQGSSIVLVTRRTKKMSWRRHKQWLRMALIKATPNDPELFRGLYSFACARAKHLRNWF